MQIDLFETGVMAAKILGVVVVLMHIAPIMAWVERRGSALMQNRLGPNRVGPLGLLYSLCDAIKFIWKEDKAPAHVEPFYYTLAPLASIVPAFMTFAAVPFASQIALGDRTVVFQIANLDVGLIYVLSVASLGVYGIIMCGWSSNNKYALLGSLRSTSQMISYELSLGLSLIGAIMVFSSVKLGDIAVAQGQTLFQLGPLAIPKWGIFIQPLGFIIFLTAIFAETNRLPFDLPEGESEIVAGYHLEYGSMKFALLMMAEYVNMFVGSAMAVTIYFGGWQLLPGMDIARVALSGALGLEGVAREWLRVFFELGSFGAKVAFFMWLFVWVRWTLPRFRYDQLMDLGWRVMLPLSLVNIFVTGFLIYRGVL